MAKVLNINVFNVIYKPEAEGGYTAVVPSLPGCVTYGKDLKEAKKMVGKAIIVYLASLKKHSESISSDEGTFFSTVNVQSNFFPSFA